MALGVLLAAVTPPRWLAAGIVAMAIADTTLVVSELLQRPNNALNAARPVANLPQLQSAVFGSAVMGYGDLFIAGVLGGLLAATVGRRLQLRAAALDGGAGAGLRPAVLLRQRAARDGAGCAGADRDDAQPAREIRSRAGGSGTASGRGSCSG